MKLMRSVVALVHDTVDLLVVDLVGLADLELVGRPSIMNRTRGLVTIGTWIRWPAPKDGCESRCGMMRPPASSFAAIARMIVPPGGYKLRMISCMTGTATSASRSQPGCLRDLDRGPVLDVREQQHDRARLLVDLVVLLALDVLVPGGLVLGEDGGAERLHPHLAEAADRDADVHRARQKS